MEINTFGWIFSIVIIACVGYYVYRRKSNSQGLPVSFEIDTPAERIGNLSLSDVRTFFKGIPLQKGQDIPILKRIRREKETSYVLAVYHETGNNLTNIKHLLPDTVDPAIEEMLGNDDLVVLS